MEIVILGCNGMVGESFTNYLENLEIDNKVRFVASDKSKGKEIKYKNNLIKCETIDDLNFLNNFLFVNMANKKVSEIIKNKMSKNSILIDNSNKFRMHKNVPLVIPHINFPRIKYNIYSNPNCSTILLCCLLKPLLKFEIKRIVVSTYQAASGAGREGLEELKDQTNEFLDNKELTKNFWKKQYAFNCFVHNSPITNEDYNEEEIKMINETSKIFNKKINLTCTCIRVPTLTSHGESINIEFSNDVTKDEILEEIRLDENLVFKKQPDILDSKDQEKVYVGHIRKDNSQKNTFNFWLTGDQVIRGASYNAIEILKKLLS